MNLHRISALLIVVFLLSGCDADPYQKLWRPVGHPCAEVDDAVQIKVEPREAAPLRYTGGGPLEGNPFIAVWDWMKNVSDEPVVVQSCTGRAYDSQGEPLFIVKLPIVSENGGTIFRPGDVQGDPSGSGTSGWVAPDGIAARELRQVERYDVRCDVFEWIGPVPTD